jgi:hypothetical protein
MKQRRIVTSVAGALALALGIALLYQFAGPDIGSSAPPSKDSHPAGAAVSLSPPPKPAATPTREDERVIFVDDVLGDDDLPQPVPPSTQYTDRSFGEVVKFVVRERCDEEGNCGPRPVALHEYEHYSIEELKTLAKFDGEAAIILASRLGGKSFKEARNWALRAFVMTKDPYAYHMAANYSGVAVGELIDADGNLDRKVAERAYIWMKTGYLLGVNDGSDLTQQEMILDRHGFEDRAHLDEQVDAGVAFLTRKRLELTGESF